MSFRNFEIFPFEIFSIISFGLPEFIISAFIISNSLLTISLLISSLLIANGLDAVICIANLFPISSFLPLEIPSNLTIEIIFPIFFSVAE